MLKLTQTLTFGLLGIKGYIPPITENQMENNTENEMETGSI